MVTKRGSMLIVLFLVFVLMISGCSPQLSPGKQGIQVKELFEVQGKDCVTPTSGMTITGDTTFCTGTHDLPNGVTISGNDIVLDCSDSTLVGSSTSLGIFSTNSRITIFNCNLEGYAVGIFLNGGDQNVIQSNVITGGEKGINLMQSDDNIIINNLLVDNTNFGSSYGGYGIYSTLSAGNVFEGNSIHSNNIGISLQYDSNDNEFNSNTVCSNADYDVTCEDSSNNFGMDNVVCDENLTCFGEGSGGEVSISQVFGAPGDKVVSGRTYTVSGSGFGSKNPVEPILFDTIENQVAYDSLNHGDTIPTRDSDGYVYPWWSNGYSSAPWDIVNDNVKYWDTDNRIEGRPHYHAEGAGFLSGGNFDDEISDDLYINWWTKVNYNLYNLPSTCDVGAGANIGTVNTKLLKIWPGWVGETSSKGRITLESDDLTRGNSFQEVTPPCVDYFGYVPENSHLSLWDDIDDVNEWQNMEAYVNNAGHDSGQGAITTWSNGEVQHDDLIFCSKDPQTLIRAIGVHTYTQVPGGLPDDRRNDWHCFEDVYGAPLQIDFGDVYIDNTLAKVMICDFATWSERTTGYCEMQYPKDSWNSSSVSFETNQGSFDFDQILYIYVMNSYGDVSEGYPIIFESEPEIGENLIQNPSFDLDEGLDFYPAYTRDDNASRNLIPDGWNTYHSTGIMDDLTAYEGDASVNVSPGSSSQTGNMNQYVPVEVGKTYIASGWMKVDSTCQANPDCKATLGLHCDVGLASVWNCPIDVDDWPTVRSTDWTYVETQFTVDFAGTTHLEVACYNSPLDYSVDSGHVWCDTFSLEEVSSPLVGEGCGDEICGNAIDDDCDGLVDEGCGGSKSNDEFFQKADPDTRYSPVESFIQSMIRYFFG
jgi:parallel beta-helix repeat protein